jgi:response regulator RpfG family c-di-GMP phosphodiesterase
MSKLPVLLCVDDEPLVLNSLERLFEDDYEVLKALSGQEALRHLQSKKVDVLVSDQRMPGMTGVQLLEKVKAASPNTMRVLLTGYADLDAVRAAVNDGEVFRYLTKPWSNAVLSEVVRSSLEAARLSESLLNSAAAVAPAAAMNDAILLIDPDPKVAEIVRGATSPYRVHHAHTIGEALATLDHDPKIWLVMTEVRIEGQEVADILSVLKSLNPGLVAVVLTSIFDAGIVIRLINEGQILRFVGKPLEAERIKTITQFARSRHLQLSEHRQLAARFRVQQSETARALLEKAKAIHQAPVRPAAVANSAAPNQPATGVLQRIFSMFSRR